MVRQHNERVALNGKSNSELADTLKREPVLLGENATGSRSVKLPAVSYQSVSTDESKLNKLERAWLVRLRAEFGAENVGVQNLTFKLADRCRFTPDMVIRDGQRIIADDVKGFQREDALVKIKVAARLFTWCTFRIVTRDRSGAWTVKTVNP